MTDLTGLLERWFSIHEQRGTRQALRDGVTDIELSRAEDRLGFPLHHDVRELYRFSNGSGGPYGVYGFLPRVYDFPTLEIAVDTYASTTASIVDEDGERYQEETGAPVGAPGRSIAVFGGPDLPIYVDCGPVAAGFVWSWSVDGFFWVASSLAELFDFYLLCEEHGLLDWGVPHQTVIDMALPREIAAALGRDDPFSVGRWRW